jgi:CheY-like chemotaxis protein
MKLLKVEYGVFPEVKALNNNFSETSGKLCIVLETNFENSLEETPRHLNLEKFYPFFSTLKHHSCGQCVSHQSSSSNFSHQTSNEILTVEDRIDIAHYMEHMILDLQFQLGKSEQLSGVTHLVKDQNNQFVIYVECENMQQGIFSINLVTAIMHQALYSGRIDPRYHYIIKLAKWLTDNGIGDKPIQEFKEDLNIDNSLLLYCINSLNAFHFSDRKIIFNSEIRPSDIGPILIIEDNDLVRETVAENLKEVGFETIVASDGRTGLAKLNEYTVGAVIIDIYLPDIDGIALAKWILECQPSVSIILTSGLLKVPEGQAIANRAIRYLPKPIEIKILTDILKRLHQ